jgi:hypothetical protein
MAAGRFGTLIEHQSGMSSTAKVLILQGFPFKFPDRGRAASQLDDFQHESVLPYKIARGSVDRDEAITSGARK